MVILRACWLYQIRWLEPWSQWTSDVCTTTTQHVPNVHGVWNTVGSRCTSIAGSLGWLVYPACLELILGFLWFHIGAFCDRISAVSIFSDQRSLNSHTKTLTPKVSLGSPHRIGELTDRQTRCQECETMDTFRRASLGKSLWKRDKQKFNLYRNLPWLAGTTLDWN